MLLFFFFVLSNCMSRVFHSLSPFYLPNNYNISLLNTIEALTPSNKRQLSSVNSIIFAIFIRCAAWIVLQYHFLFAPKLINKPTVSFFLRCTARFVFVFFSLFRCRCCFVAASTLNTLTRKHFYIYNQISSCKVSNSKSHATCQRSLCRKLITLKVKPIPFFRCLFCLLLHFVL